MTISSIRLYVAVFLAVFLLILVVGITSEVSVPAVLTRALTAAAVFTAVFLLVVNVAARYLVLGPPNTPERANADSALGRNLDFTAAEPVSFQQPASLETTSSPVQSTAKNSLPEFIPLNARQIDPQMSKIINEDPQKVAEIVRKMGLEEN